MWALSTGALCTHMACLNNNNVLINFWARTEDGPRAGPVPKSSIKLAKSTRTPCCNSSNRGPANQPASHPISVCLSLLSWFFLLVLFDLFCSSFSFPRSLSHIIRLGAVLLLFLGPYSFSCPLTSIYRLPSLIVVSLWKKAKENRNQFDMIAMDHNSPVDFSGRRRRRFLWASLATRRNVCLFWIFCLPAIRLWLFMSWTHEAYTFMARWNWLCN